LAPGNIFGCGLRIVAEIFDPVPNRFFTDFSDLVFETRTDAKLFTTVIHGGVMSPGGVG